MCDRAQKSIKIFDHFLPRKWWQALCADLTAGRWQVSRNELYWKDEARTGA